MKCEVGLTVLKAHDIMQTEVFTAPYTARVSEIVRELTRGDREEVVVVDEREHPCGLITRKSLLRRISEGLDLESPIGSVMQQPVITVKSTDDVGFVREVMREHTIGRVPVVNGTGRLVGLITAMAICNGFSDRLYEVGSYLRALIDSLTIAVLVFNKFCRLVYWNESAQRLYRDKVRRGSRCRGIFDQQLIKGVLKTGEPRRNIYEVWNGRHLIKSINPISQGEEVVGVVCTVEDVTRVINLMRKASEAEQAVAGPGPLPGSSYTSPQPPCFEVFWSREEKARKVVRLAQKVAATDVTVLIRGETGTGKELMARSLHYASARRDKPFVVVDCSAIPEKLFESELFGYEPGAFTGALKSGKKGKLELADGGTLFLDEIGELPLEVQAKLLRVIQEREFYRVGGLKPVRIDVRFIAATNRNLEQMVKEGSFREDLFYRLNVITLELPSLREKPADERASLIEAFIRDFAAFYKVPVAEVEEAVLAALTRYHWPGNYRELRNVTERLVLLAEGGCIRYEHLPENIREAVGAGGRDEGQDAGGSPSCLEDFLKEKEKEAILKALKEHAYNKARAARALNIPRSTLYYKMKALQIEV